MSLVTPVLLILMPKGFGPQVDVGGFMEWIQERLRICTEAV